MTENVTDEEWAQSLTGCVRNDYDVLGITADYDGWFCETHDEDGNPAWNECRWARVAEALGQARREAEAKVERVLAIVDRIAADPANVTDELWVYSIRKALDVTA